VNKKNNKLVVPPKAGHSSTGSGDSLHLRTSRKPDQPLRIGVVDFFCGAGGVSAGLKATESSAEFEIILGIDNDPHCAETFKRMIGANCEQIDVLELANSNDTLEKTVESWNVKKFDKLLLVGCAPCQGFAAHRKSFRDEDPRRNLFEAFCRIAETIKPDAIFMENVPDLFSAGHWHHFAAGRDTLLKAGYHVEAGIYNFAGFGLPQERFRAVVIAQRNEFSLPKAPLPPGEYRTVRDAIGHLRELESGERDPNDPMHVASRHRESTLKTLRSVPKDGGNRPIGVGPACLDRTRAAHGGYTDVYGRLAWDKASVTITARCRTPSCGRFTHPEQDRGLTTREAALLQGFPPHYVFSGPFDDGFKQVGNAVSPLVAKAFGEYLAESLSGASLERWEEGEPPIAVKGTVGPGFAVTINGIKRQRARVNAA